MKKFFQTALKGFHSLKLKLKILRFWILLNRFISLDRYLVIIITPIMFGLIGTLIFKNQAKNFGQYTALIALVLVIGIFALIYRFIKPPEERIITKPK